MREFQIGEVLEIGAVNVPAPSNDYISAYIVQMTSDTRCVVLESFSEETQEWDDEKFKDGDYSTSWFGEDIVSHGVRDETETK